MGFFEVFSGILAAFYAVIPSYGVAIILLTIFVRLLLLPLTIKQTRSMREMQLIQPEVKKLQAKYKGNRQKMNEELMALYKEHGVNPLGGCLPLVMQIPVFIALFNVIQNPLKYMGYTRLDTGAYDAQDVTGLMARIQDSSLAEGLRDSALTLNKFLGIRLDCSAASAVGGDQSDAVPIGPVCGDGVIDALPFILLVALMGFSTYYQTRQMQAQRSSSDPQAQQMQLMGKIMPAVLVIFSWGFPAGLLLYWITSNAWTIGQQRLMLRTVPPITPGARAAGKAAKKTGAKPPRTKPEVGSPTQPAAEAEGQRSAGKPHPASKKKKRRR